MPRTQALFETTFDAVTEMQEGSGPADARLSAYFRQHRKLGAHEIAAAEEMTEEQREAAARAAASAGISVKEPEDDEAAEAEQKFGTADVDYIFDQSPEQLFRDLLPRFYRWGTRKSFTL